MAIRRPPTTFSDSITGADLASDIAISTTGNIATTGSGALSVAGNSTLSGTNNLGSNPTVTLGSNATFPAGMIIKKSLITYAEMGASAIETNSTSYTDTGVGGSFTVKTDSSSSYLKFIVEQGMSQVNAANITGETDFCLTASNNTSHSDGNSLYGSLSYKNYTRYGGGAWYGRYSSSAIFNVGTRVTTNLTSYSAGDTLYIRIFIKSGNGTYYHTFAHAHSHYMLTVEEISK